MKQAENVDVDVDMDVDEQMGAKRKVPWRGLLYVPPTGALG